MLWLKPAGGVADFAGGVAQLGASALQIHKDIGQTAGAEVEQSPTAPTVSVRYRCTRWPEIALGQRGQRIAQRLPVLVSDAHHDHAGNQRGQLPASAASDQADHCLAGSTASTRGKLVASNSRAKASQARPASDMGSQLFGWRGGMCSHDDSLRAANKTPDVVARPCGNACTVCVRLARTVSPSFVMVLWSGTGGLRHQFLLCWEFRCDRADCKCRKKTQLIQAVLLQCDDCSPLRRTMMKAHLRRHCALALAQLDWHKNAFGSAAQRQQASRVLHTARTAHSPIQRAISHARYPPGFQAVLSHPQPWWRATSKRAGWDDRRLVPPGSVRPLNQRL